MTRNQRRAIDLACDIRTARIQAERLTDTDWDLLLLAAGMNKCAAPPLLIADRVLDHAERQIGYFAETAPVELNLAFRLSLECGFSNEQQNASSPCGFADEGR